MFEVSIIKYFSGAHNLRNYRGKCESLHGHNWKVELTLSGSKLDKTGMLYDFSLLKSQLDEILSSIDHKYLNEIPPFDKMNPTAESIARYIYHKLKVKSKKLKWGYNRIRLKKVTVWESETSCATYA